MSHRIGECSSCGAQYKLPASFSADRARCKQCDGVVEIGPPVDSAPAPAEPQPLEVKKKKREGPSMKDRLLAQRQEAEGRAKPVPARKPAPKRAERPAGKRDEKPSAKSGVRSSRSAGPAKSRRKSSRRRDDDDEAEERSSSRSRSARGRKAPKKAPVLPFILAILAFGFVGAGVWHMFFRPEEAPAPTPDEVADAGQDPEGGGDLAPGGGDPEETAPGEGDPEEAATDEGDPEGTDPEEEAPEKKPTELPKAIPGDPNSIDLSAFPEYGAVDGCSEERFLELKQLAAEMVDPMAGAAGNRARIKLEKAGKEAFPVIVNVMKKLDLTDEEQFRSGDVCQKTLQDICNGMNAGWWYPDTSPDEYLFKNKQAIKLWCTTWERVKDDEEKWLILTKQKKRGDPAEEAKEEEAATEDELDDLDDL